MFVINVTGDRNGNTYETPFFAERLYRGQFSRMEFECEVNAERALRDLFRGAGIVVELVSKPRSDDDWEKRGGLMPPRLRRELASLNRTTRRTVLVTHLVTEYYSYIGGATTARQGERYECSRQAPDDRQRAFCRAHCDRLQPHQTHRSDPQDCG